MSVRCAGGDWRSPAGTRLFHLTCRADAAALEYRVGADGAVRTVAITALGGTDPAFVDIGF